MKTWNGNNYSNRFGSYKLQCEALVHTKGVSTVMIYVPTLTQQHHNLLCGSVCVPSPLDGVGAKGESGGGV